MLVLAAASVMLVLGDERSIREAPWEHRNEVPGYRAGFIPQPLKSLKPQSVVLDEGAVRGYRSIQSHWVVKESFSKVVLQLAKEMKADPRLGSLGLKSLEQRQSFALTKQLSDRSITAQIFKGRPVVTKSKNVTRRDYGDKETYASITLFERPLLVGSKPKTWPKAASKGQTLPKAFPTAAIKVVNGPPATWTRSGNPDGSITYYAFWYLKREPSSVTAQYRKQTTNDPTWPVLNLRIEFEPGARMYNDVPQVGLTCVRVSWTDISTRLKSWGNR